MADKADAARGRSGVNALSHQALLSAVAGVLAVGIGTPARAQSAGEAASSYPMSAAGVARTIEASRMPHFQDLPDWSGVWAEIGNTVFDPDTVQPPGGSANEKGTREYPPLTDEWEQRYEHNLDLVAQDRFPDPITNCGVPVGFPRIFNLPDVYEFVVRPEETWILTENGPNVMRIYTDGRLHPAPEDVWLTYTGDSVGYWDGETLVFSTIAVKNEGTILDRTGLTLSNEMTAVTRMRKVADDRLELEMVLRDPLALKEAWHVKTAYRRLPEGTRVYDYACAENNRNPVTDNGFTITLGPNGEPLNGPGAK
jgi:hypothetical protein